MQAQWRHLLVAFLLLLGACATVPETGRKQLTLVSSQELTQMGRSEFENIKENTPISRDPEQTALVEGVGRRIAAVAPVEDAQWEFVLFDEPEVLNAFALPGGKVGVYSGLLRITENDAGLATVMGHEVAHVVAQHGNERVSQGLLVELGGVALATAARTEPAATQQLLLAAYGAGATVGVALPFSRKHELEADYIGVLYMARAGYDPEQSIAFWQRFAAATQGQGAPPEFLSTHPLDETRIAQLQELMPRAKIEYEEALKARPTSNYATP